MAKLNGKVALITGAARGIGAETARALVRQGSKLILTDRDGEPLNALAAEIGEERVVAGVCDVCDLASMEEAVAAGVERFGGIDLVLANAGIASYGSVMAVDPVMFKRVLDVNVLGVFHTVRAALPSLIERKGYVLRSEPCSTAPASTSSRSRTSSACGATRTSRLRARA